MQRALGAGNVLYTIFAAGWALGVNPEIQGRSRGQGMNHLYYGDNLNVLRESIRDESVDLIYLDPPFNSNASYNVLFKGPQGTDSAEASFGKVIQSECRTVAPKPSKTAYC